MKEIILANGRGIALVDDGDYELVSQYKWCLMGNCDLFYAVTGIRKADNSRTILRMHRLLMNPKTEEEIDHRDNNGLNNQRSNLRVCTKSQNMMNQRKTRGTSQYKGVSWYTRAKKWRAKINLNKKCIHLGIFEDEVEAAGAYDRGAKKYFGEFARLNLSA